MITAAEERILNKFLSEYQYKETQKEYLFNRCPYCNGGRKDTFTFSLNKETGQFNCFRDSCGVKGNLRKIARDLFPETISSTKNYKRVDAEIRRFLEERRIVTCEQYFKNRGISKETINIYNVSDYGNNMVALPFYDPKGELIDVKIRTTNKFRNANGKELPKEFFKTSDTKKILFGMNVCDKSEKNEIIITEGLIDAMSIAECGIYNVVSVPNGAKGLSWIAHCSRWIDKFDTIIFFTDLEKGKLSMLSDISKRFKNHQIKCVKKNRYHGCKDANELLCKYGKKAIEDALNDLETKEPAGIVNVSKVEFENHKDLPKLQTSYPYLNLYTKGGFLYGTTTVITGSGGEGKSTLLSQLLIDVLEDERELITFCYSNELRKSTFKNWLYTQIAGDDRVDIEVEYDKITGEQIKSSYLKKEYVDIIDKYIGDKVYLFDNDYMYDPDYSGVIDMVETAFTRLGVRVVMIDNLMTAIDVAADNKVNEEQTKFINKLAGLSKKYNGIIFLVAHAKKHKPDLRELFDNNNVQGSSNVVKSADYVLYYRRTKKEVEVTDENDLYQVGEREHEAIMELTKNRPVGDLGRIYLNFNNTTKRLQQGCIATDIATSRLKEIKTFSEITISCFKEKAPTEVEPCDYDPKTELNDMF